MEAYKIIISSIRNNEYRGSSQQTESFKLDLTTYKFGVVHIRWGAAGGGTAWTAGCSSWDYLCAKTSPGDGQAEDEVVIWDTCFYLLLGPHTFTDRP